MSLIKAAKIVAAHGIRGQVKIKSLLPELPEALLTKDGTPFSFTPRGNAGDVIIADIAGVKDRNAAEALKGTELYAEEAALPALKDGEYYIDDLVSLDVRAGKEIVGKIVGVYDYGAGDVVEVRFSDGRMEMFPFRHAVFPEVNIADGFVSFVPPEVTE